MTASVAAAMASPVSVALSPEDGEAGEMISKVISKVSPVLRFRLFEFSLTISAIRILLQY